MSDQIIRYYAYKYCKYLATKEYVTWLNWSVFAEQIKYCGVGYKTRRKCGLWDDVYPGLEMLLAAAWKRGKWEMVYSVLLEVCRRAA